MAEPLVFYTNPQSRGAIVRWMLEEAGATYETVLLDYGTTMKAPEYLAINPMGKVPAIRHGDQVVTECGAICAYLADAFPEAGLAPAPAQRGAYYRWLCFGAGPIEAVFTTRAMGWDVPAEKQGMAGFGSFDLTIDTIAGAVAGRPFLAGDRFSAADVYVASLLDFMLTFGMLSPRAEFDAYLAPLRERPAYRRAKEIDAALVPAKG
ncbi:MAG: glutathione S-transferase family protein [Sphingomonadales bacterium]|nr:glutathione S-transferase family protein [Sphingomonadales bacterium]